MAAFDRAGLDRVEHLQAGNDLARCEGADLKFAVRRCRNALGHELAGAVDGVEALGKARRQAPPKLRRVLRDRRGREGRRGRSRGGNRSAPDHLTTTYHDVPFPVGRLRRRRASALRLARNSLNRSLAPPWNSQAFCIGLLSPNGTAVARAKVGALPE
jgi:hypothetical protein